MRNKIFIPVYLTLAVLLFLSCSDSGNDSYDIRVGIFPNEVRDWWLYKVTDSLTHEVDTVLVRILGKTALETGDPVTIWGYINHGEVDTSYVRIASGYLTPDSAESSRVDTVFFHADRTGNNISEILIFPLKVGAVWRGAQPSDTVRVTGRVLLNTRAGRYDAFIVQTTRQQFENVINSRRWVVHNLGLAQWDYKWLSGTVQGNQGWELLDWLPEGAMPQPK